MASRSSGGGGSFYGGSAPYRSRPAASSDEIQLRIDPIHGDLEDEITGLRSQVRQLRNVAQEIETEAKYQKDFLETLLAFHDMTANDCDEAQAGVKNNIRKLNRSVIKNGGNHIVHVVLFALFCFLVVYLWSKMSRR
ncbi:bet1 protein [Salix suchowensis]|nr:bet1 protein [Salix suchowensis]